ncbi:MAG: dTDP-4-dehydrorhamnose reductase [Candidatus Schekmanbacteria bacterium]|nr:MAG: dTDP-4-dehydrorhamnose reductase [Candidatus Schekmanbacteria bacterium]
MSKKALVTGAAGMLGSDLCPCLEKNGYDVIRTDINLRESTIEKLDVRNFDEVKEFIEKENPEIVFHLAAETDVDLCEKDPEHSYRSNYIATENIAMVCREKNLPMIYISTSAIFDGTAPEPYTEYDLPNPSNVYGRSKLEGEKAVIRLVEEHYIIRAGWMVGGWDIDKKFTRKIIELLKKNDEIKAVNDKVGSPTFTFDLSESIVRIVKNGRPGIYHSANKGQCTRYEYACKLIELMGLKEKKRVVPVSSAHFPLPAPRGRSEAMVNMKLNVLNMNKMPTWEESLEKYLKIYVKD